jgi:deazaflavin-dependent oxidoreductase (nitroreductase family)
MSTFDASQPLSPAPAPRGAPIFIRIQVALYRATGGRIGGRVGRTRLLLLTTVGRKSGRRQAVPLGYFMDGTMPYLVASNSGRDQHPGWYLNLVDHPQVEVELGSERWPAVAEVVADDEQRQRLWAKVKRQAPSYGRYEHKTTRQIPLVWIQRTPVTSG